MNRSRDTRAGDVRAAAAAALRGEAIVVPTDTVYGLGTRPDDADATVQLFALKRRPVDLELPVLVPTAEQAALIAVLDERASALAARFWPGGLTLVLRRADAASAWALGGDPRTIGVRVPRHRVTREVLDRAGPLAVTSANRSGEPTPTTCDGVREVFGDGVAVYLCDDAEETLRPRAASTVVDLAHGEPRVLRAGAVSEEDVRAVLDAYGRGATEGPV